MEKITKITVLAVLGLSLVANAISFYRSTTPALIIAGQNGYATCVNEVNQLIKDGKLVQAQPAETQPIAQPTFDHALTTEQPKQ